MIYKHKTFKLTFKETHRTCECRNYIHVLIEIDKFYHYEPYTLGMQAWFAIAENGDVFDDNYIHIEAICV